MQANQAIDRLNREFVLRRPEAAALAVADWDDEDLVPFLEKQPAEGAARLLSGLNADTAVAVLPALSPNTFRAVFTRIDAARGGALLARIDREAREELLTHLPKTLAVEFRELSSYPTGTAGRYMDPSVTEFHPDETVEQALARIRRFRDRRITDICVIGQDSRLLGTIPIVTVAVSEAETRLAAIMNSEPASVQAMAPQEDVAQILERARISSLPVTDIEGRLVGIIRYDALVTAAQQDITEDLQAMFGAGREERALSPVFFAVRKRLPWLEINLATAFLAAAVVGMFEETIAKITALAVFLPVVAGQSGNTGSQALAVTMRGLALREVRMREWFRLASKETAVGLINGVAVAVTTALIAFFWMNSAGLSIVIGVAMVISMIVAGFSGAIIPILLKALGQDPAQSSSIVLTTVTDIVGFMTFLGLAKLILSTMQP